MKKNIVIFEVEGGSDKWLNGLRRDTMPILNAIKELGWDCEVIYYRDEWSEDILEYASEKFSGFISRINPGNLPNGEDVYLKTLNRLCDAGLVGMSSPEEMLKLGSKDIIYKLRNTAIGTSDTHIYFDRKDFLLRFPYALAQGTRVIKQNRGSTGVGIWKVEIKENSSIYENEPLPLDTLIKCTEAKDNHVEYCSLENFIVKCHEYLEGSDEHIIDMPFLPRIAEGELRILLLGDKATNIILKTPFASREAFSTTLFSGAQYSIHETKSFSTLVQLLQDNLQYILKVTDLKDYPLFWSADFIRDTDKNGQDKYILSEINTSCVGIPSKLLGTFEKELIETAIAKIISKQKCRIE